MGGYYGLTTKKTKVSSEARKAQSAEGIESGKGAVVVGGGSHRPSPMWVFGVKARNFFLQKISTLNLYIFVHS